MYQMFWGKKSTTESNNPAQCRWDYKGIIYDKIIVKRSSTRTQFILRLWIKAAIYCILSIDTILLILQMAKASTLRYAKGQPLSFLDGVPVGIKEEFEVVRCY